MALQMLVLFSFQIAVGFLYQMIGLLFAAFMGGNMLGSILGIQTTKKKNIHLVLKKIELMVVLLNPLVILLLLFMQKYTASIHPNTLIILFSLINFTTGALSGSQYPIAAFLKSVNGLDKTGGSLYALDLLGGWVGGTIVALLFFPLIGLVKTIILLGALKLGSLLTLNRALHNS